MKRIVKGTPCLTFTPDQHISTRELVTDAATGIWRLGRVTDYRGRGTAHRIVTAVDGSAVTVISGRTHTLEPGESYGISIQPIADRPETRALIGTTWTDGASVFATLEPIRQTVISEGAI